MCHAINSTALGAVAGAGAAAEGGAFVRLFLEDTYLPGALRRWLHGHPHAQRLGGGS